MKPRKRATQGKASKGLISRLRGVLRFRYLTVALLCVVICIGATSSVWLLRKSALFSVREVIFDENKHFSEGELRHLAAITPGESLLRISMSDVSKRLMKSPWIKGVSIRKEFPHKLLIKIHETTPFAILEMKGRSFLVDDRGELLEEMKDAIPFLPVITADPFRNRDNFLEALGLARAIKDKKIAAEKDRVEIIADKGPQDISMVIDNVVIKMGRGDYEHKLERLFGLEEEIKSRAITVDYVDLRFANRIVVKPMNGVVK